VFEINVPMAEMAAMAGSGRVGVVAVSATVVAGERSVFLVTLFSIHRSHFCHRTVDYKGKNRNG
jgi:hypothetical protein